MKRSYIVLMLMTVFAAAIRVEAQKLPGDVCGDPTAACKGGEHFQPYELPFNTGKNFVIGESRWFYGIVLKSKKVRDYGDCANPVFNERERLSVQKLFPTNKVFALNCIESGSNYYNGITQQSVFVAVYAGKTLAEANRFLKTVQQDPQFQAVRVRRMQIAINGT
ncbi:MAG: hypothetical protein ABIV21_07350 [Pyrinomonadaceae bacterium]